jgi:nucleoid-associated protein YgaU
MEDIMSTENQKSKSILDKAIDAVSSRDEKAKLEAALKELQAAKQAAAQATAAAASASAQTQAEAQKAVLAANQRAAAAEAQTKALQERLQQIQDAEMQQLETARRIASEARAATASAPKIIAEHTVKPEETLSQLALKYYGHATEPYWMLIYNTNKDVIGGNPNRIRNGLVIKIPELTPELKK